MTSPSRGKFRNQAERAIASVVEAECSCARSNYWSMMGGPAGGAAVSPTWSVRTVFEVSQCPNTVADTSTGRRYGPHKRDRSVRSIGVGPQIQRSKFMA